MNRNRTFLTGVVISALVTLCAQQLVAQPKPEQQKKEGFRNLQVINKNIPEDDLIALMKIYSGSLGVRCDFCHLESADHKETFFDSDSLEHKRIARDMMKMVADINGKYLTQATGETVEQLTGAVNCMTCHRGSKKPVFIEDVMMRAHAAGGADSVMTAYKNLREVWYGRAKYDFGAPPMTNFAATLFDTDTLGAMKLQAMNMELNPKSTEAMFIYAQMLLERHDSTTALYYIDSCLVMMPQHRGATGLKKTLTDNGVTRSTPPAKQ